jgi:hypothetical protein
MPIERTLQVREKPIVSTLSTYAHVLLLIRDSLWDLVGVLNLRKAFVVRGQVLFC